MKKSLITLATVLLVSFFASCSSVRPLMVTDNPITANMKVGKASITYLLGIFPMGEDNIGLEKATKDGRIIKVYFVDQKVEYGFLFLTTTVTTTVYGE